MFRAPHVHALSVLFNRISYLCACEILGAKNHENRVENLTKCSELAKTLKKVILFITFLLFFKTNLIFISDGKF